MELLIEIFVYSWLITFLFCISISVSYPILKDYYDNKFEIFIPLYNIFRLFRVIGYSELFGFLFLIPFLNIVMMHLLGYGLSKEIETYKFFKIGYIILPILFIPLSAFIKYREKEEKIEKFEEINKVKKVEKVKKAKKDTTNEPVETFEVEVNPEPNEELYSDEEDESIFKLKTETKESYSEDNKPYKAKRVMVNQKFIDSAPAEQERIEKVEKDKKN